MKTTPADPIDIALREDIGAGDVTTDSFVPKTAKSAARILARERAIVAGTQTTAAVFQRVDGDLNVEILREDGSEVRAGDPVMEIEGSSRSILKAERVALNFLQRLSGIATMTRNFVEAAANEQVKILDTRKTTPGLRKLEKEAVVAGGGVNHRLGLFDMVLIKDNHLTAVADSDQLREAIRNVRETRPDVRIEIEADTLEQVRAFLEIDEVDVILLDNMTPAEMREAVALGKNKVKFEASGGITLKNVQQIAATGVDYISIGALTHSPRAIDFSLEMTDAGA